MVYQLYPEIRIAAGHNNTAGFVTAESVMGLAPRCTPVPRGSVTTLLSSGGIRRDGFKNFTWEWRILPFEDFSAFVTAYIGGFDTEYGLVTVRTRLRAMTYGNFNAKLYLPIIGGDEREGSYEQPTSSKVINVRFVFADAVAI